MLIVDDKALAEAGIDFDTAVALLKPEAHTLVVRVKRELGPPVSAISSPVIDPPPGHEQPEAAPAVSQPTQRLHAATEVETQASTTDMASDARVNVEHAAPRPSSDAVLLGLTHPALVQRQIDALHAQLQQATAMRDALVAELAQVQATLAVPAERDPVLMVQGAPIQNPPVSQEYQQRQDALAGMPAPTMREEVPPHHRVARQLDPNRPPVAVPFAVELGPAPMRSGGDTGRLD